MRSARLSLAFIPPLLFLRGRPDDRASSGSSGRHRRRGPASARRGHLTVGQIGPPMVKSTRRGHLTFGQIGQRMVKRTRRGHSDFDRWPRRPTTNGQNLTTGPSDAEVAQVLVDEALHLHRALAVDRLLGVELLAVLHHEVDVALELVNRLVESLRQTLLHRRQRDRVLDHRVVVGHVLRPHLLPERPAGLRLDHGGQGVGDDGAQLRALHHARALGRLEVPPAMRLVREPGLLHPRDVGKVDGLDPLLEALEPRVDGVVLGHGADLALHHAPLPLDHGGDVEVVDVGVDEALHERRALVVLNVGRPPRALHRDGLVEALLLEVAHGEVVGVGQEVVEAVHLAGEVLGLVHEPRAVAPHLLLRLDGAEGDLAEAHLFNRAVAYSANDAEGAALPLHCADRLVLSIKNQSNYVLWRHLGELLAKDVFEVTKISKICSRTIVEHVFKLQHAGFFFLLGRCISCFDLAISRIFRHFLVLGFFSRRLGHSIWSILLFRSV
mmetsp:Transcript_67363/g.179843  ORF Transcript_67363/g.179843 Transcript_67363/m.179843 type:complete len:496 (-) Transcript_67363:59-1546(-)